MEIEIIEEKAREEALAEKLAKANEKVYKWMAGIEPNEIEGTIGDWDKLSLLKMVEMADQEIRVHPQKFV
jgi:phosphoribosylamine-glycine ligase